MLNTEKEIKKMNNKLYYNNKFENVLKNQY